MNSSMQKQVEAAFKNVFLKIFNIKFNKKYSLYHYIIDKYKMLWYRFTILMEKYHKTFKNKNCVTLKKFKVSMEGVP